MGTETQEVGARRNGPVKEIIIMKNRRRSMKKRKKNTMDQLVLVDEDLNQFNTKAVVPLNTTAQRKATTNSKSLHKDNNCTEESNSHQTSATSVLTYPLDEEAENMSGGICT